MLKIKIQINTSQLQKLTVLGNKVNNLAPILDEIGQAVSNSTRVRFKDSQAPDYSRWKPLSPVTIARRRKGSAQPLLDTGRLRSSITHVVGNDFVDIGTDVVYAPTQQFGAKKGQYGSYDTLRRKGIPIPWGDVPARPFIGLSVQDEIEINAIILKYLKI